MIKLEDIVMTSHDMLFAERQHNIVTYLHLVRQPGYSEDGFYQQGRSASAFRQRETKRLAEGYKKGKIPARWFSGKSGDQTLADELEQEERIRKGLRKPSWNHEWRSAIFIEHKTVYDFYKCIGYDYKTQKWL